MRLFALTLSCFLATSCEHKAITDAPTHAKQTASDFSFKTAFAQDFLVGTALSKDQILSEDHVRELAGQQFNAVTAENEMKWERINPQPGEYHWESADALVNFSEKHHLFITGHTLLWHQQVPSWVFANEEQVVSKKDLEKRLKQHIETVVTRYKGRIQSWDVVNEALNEDGSLRNSDWLKILGPDYIEQAFTLAHAADPNAKLYYNDYNLFKPEKRAGAIKLVKRLQNKGIKIHGIGLQGHYGLGYPEDLKQIEDSIVEFSKLGVEVMITELDISVLPFPDEDSRGADISLDFELQEKFNPFANGLTDTAKQQFNQQYKDIFSIFLKHSDKISRVTFWGVHDGQSWRNNWPMKGRSDYPLLIDRNLKVKDVAKTLKSVN